MKTHIATLAGVAAMVLGVTGSADAQAAGTTTWPAFELGAAYQYVLAWREGGRGGQDQWDPLPVGFAVDAAVQWDRLGLVVEGAWTNDALEWPGYSETTTFVHIGGGPRFVLNTSGGVRPYAQVLVGASKRRLIAEGSVSSHRETETGIMLQPGVGATFMPSDGWGLFGDIAYRLSSLDYGSSKGIRVLFGARIILD